MSNENHRGILPGCLLLILMACSIPAAAFEIKPYEIRYETTIRGIKVNTVRKLSGNATSFTLTQNISAFRIGTEEKSTFSLTDNRISPASYTYKRSVFGSSLARETLFYPEQKKASFREGNSPAENIPLDGETYDPLNFYIPLQMHLAEHPDTTNLAPLKILDKVRVRQFAFRLVGTEWLQTPLGFMQTLKIERTRSDNDKQTFIWLAKEWDYVVVKIMHQQPGEPVYQMNIVSGNIDNKPISGSLLPEAARLP